MSLAAIGVSESVLGLLVIWVLCLVASAHGGQWLWFGLGLIFPPLALVGALLPPKPASKGGRKRYRQCPACAEHVRKQATVCRYCGAQLEPMRPLIYTPPQNTQER